MKRTVPDEYQKPDGLWSEMPDEYQKSDGFLNKLYKINNINQLHGYI